VLKIKPIMNSTVEDILNFKTCCGPRAFDQNLEILITNTGTHSVIIPSYFDLVSDSAVERVRNLMPHGEHRLAPQETMAFYCQMDEDRWAAARELVLYDHVGNRFPVDISPANVEE
jgi:hypothetical protein